MEGILNLINIEGYFVGWFFPYTSLKNPWHPQLRYPIPQNHSEVSPTLWDIRNGFWNKKTHRNGYTVIP